MLKMMFCAEEILLGKRQCFLGKLCEHLYEKGEYTSQPSKLKNGIGTHKVTSFCSLGKWLIKDKKITVCKKGGIFSQHPLTVILCVHLFIALPQKHCRSMKLFGALDFLFYGVAPYQLTLIERYSPYFPTPHLADVTRVFEVHFMIAWEILKRKEKTKRQLGSSR